MKMSICLRQLDETKRKHPKALGNWTKQNENANLPQAIGQNKTKTPICFKQFDETKRKHPKALGNWMSIKRKSTKIPAIDCTELLHQATDG